MASPTPADDAKQGATEHAAEDAARESAAAFRLIVESSPDFISVMTERGEYLYASPACERLIGFSPTELVGQGLMELVHTEDAPRASRLFLAHGERATYRIRHKDGTYVWVESTAAVLGPEAPRLVAITRELAAWTRQAPSVPPPSPAPPPSPSAAPRLRILVVDDEPLVGAVLRRSLLEHDVTVCTGADEALEHLVRRDPFDVIFCDLLMPGTSGPAFYGKVTALVPEAARRMIFITGGAFTTRARQFLCSVPNARIEKPFAMTAVHKAIRDTLSIMNADPKADR